MVEMSVRNICHLNIVSGTLPTALGVSCTCPPYNRYVAVERL